MYAIRSYYGYPVIKIDFTGGELSDKEHINRNIEYSLKVNAKQLDIPFNEIDNNDSGITLKALINAAYEKYNQKVVLLIDEYDKPIIDNSYNFV